MSRRKELKKLPQIIIKNLKRELKDIGVMRFIEIYKLPSTFKDHISRNEFPEKTIERLEEIRETKEYWDLVEEYKPVEDEEFFDFINRLNVNGISMVKASRKVGKCDTFFTVKIHRHKLRRKDLKKYEKCIFG